MSAGIDCPSCGREIAREYGAWLDKVRNCPFCLAPIWMEYDELAPAGEQYFFDTDQAWR